MLEEGRDGKVTHEEGLRKWMPVKEGIGVEEVRTLMKEVVGSDLSEYKVRYSLKYDRQMLVAAKRDMHVRMIFKGNDERENLCVVSNDGPRM